MRGAANIAVRRGRMRGAEASRWLSVSHGRAAGLLGAERPAIRELPRGSADTALALL